MSFRSSRVSRASEASLDVNAEFKCSIDEPFGKTPQTESPEKPTIAVKMKEITIIRVRGEMNHKEN